MSYLSDYESEKKKIDSRSASLIAVLVPGVLSHDQPRAPELSLRERPAWPVGPGDLELCPSQGKALVS